ncbi:MAG: hypothetical protein JXA54_03855 [Candidatus Heimdallarchaeota archaeon]|nr:hypothetical protein [Candidatus Heimdallarchaeota archaeon]
MKYVLFDTNVYLALIFPLDTWKAIVENSLNDIKDFVVKKQAIIVCLDKIIEEINEKIIWISDEINKEFSNLYEEIKNIKGSFTKDNILQLRKIMEHEIFREKSDKDRKNRLYYIEGLILQEINNTNELEAIDVYLNCAESINELVVRFKGEIASKIRKYNIKRIIVDKKPNIKIELDKIKKEVEKSVSNPNDAEILTQFIFYLKEKNLKGIFVTHDFRDLLLNSIALESIFNEILIVRPAYVKSLI